MKGSGDQQSLPAAAAGRAGRSAIHIRWTTTLPELAATQVVTERWITLV
jgi:hypothetical protein